MPKLQIEKNFKPRPEDAERLQTLLAMLAYKRPAGTKSERRFIKNFIRGLGVESDEIGNLYKRIGDAPIMWSAHVDTVHREAGMQKIEIYESSVVLIGRTSKSNCLGADDTAGCWLMREMILANVPGLYIFHRAEERGCIGSSWIAKKNPDLLKGIKFAVALDRRGLDNVVTHQLGDRCCSEAFANSMAKQLGMNYKPAHGVYTDTASYTHLIPECTNLSVGYWNEHTIDEFLYLPHILELREKLLNIDVSQLVCEREPKARKVYTYTYKGGDTNDPATYGSGVAKKEKAGVWAWHTRVPGATATQHPCDCHRSNWIVRCDCPAYVPKQDTSDTKESHFKQLLALVKDHPDIIADMLEHDYAVTPDDLRYEIWNRGGAINKPSKGHYGAVANDPGYDLCPKCDKLKKYCVCDGQTRLCDCNLAGSGFTCVCPPTTSAYGG